MHQSDRPQGVLVVHASEGAHELRGSLHPKPNLLLCLLRRPAGWAPVRGTERPKCRTGHRKLRQTKSSNDRKSDFLQSTGGCGWVPRRGEDVCASIVAACVWRSHLSEEQHGEETSAGFSHACDHVQKTGRRCNNRPEASDWGFCGSCIFPFFSP